MSNTNKPQLHLSGHAPNRFLAAFNRQLDQCVGGRSSVGMSNDAASQARLETMRECLRRRGLGVIVIDEVATLRPYSGPSEVRDWLRNLTNFVPAATSHQTSGVQKVKADDEGNAQ